MVTGESRVAVVIEDDADVRFLVETTLRQGGFEVQTAATGVDGVELVRAVAPDVTTLDVSLPDIDGFEVARRLRRFSDTYLVMLTGRTEEVDTLIGLDSGADDYLTKPFRPRELRARVEAMLRRPRQIAAAPPEVGRGAGAPSAVEPRWENLVLAHGGLRVDVDARLVELDGEPVHLTRSEFELLTAILEARTRVVSKNELVRRLYGEDYVSGATVSDADRRTVEVHLANLRRKLGEDAAAPRFIETVRGVGYRLTRAG